MRWHKNSIGKPTSFARSTERRNADEFGDRSGIPHKGSQSAAYTSQDSDERRCAVLSVMPAKTGLSWVLTDETCTIQECFFAASKDFSRSV